MAVTIDGVTPDIQPVAVEWEPHRVLDYDGSQRPIYAPLRRARLVFDSQTGMTPAQFAQWQALKGPRPVDATLPRERDGVETVYQGVIVEEVRGRLEGPSYVGIDVTISQVHDPV